MNAPRAGRGASRCYQSCSLLLVSFCIFHVAVAQSLGKESGLSPDAHPGNPWADYGSGGDNANAGGLTPLLNKKVAKLMLWLRDNGAQGVGDQGDANVKVRANFRWEESRFMEVHFSLQR